MTPQDVVSAFNASRSERGEEPLLLEKTGTDRYRMVPQSEAKTAPKKGRRKAIRIK